jgi:hypothetical protein
MDNDDLISSLCHDLRTVYGCHSAILYGSRARDDWEHTSDIDVIGFLSKESQRVASLWNGVYLDLFIHSDNDQVAPDWIRIADGLVLFEIDHFAQNMLTQVNDMLEKGPEPVSVEELHVRKLWSEKMVIRASRGDVEGNYRRYWLLYTLLEDYFVARGQWYLGPKKSFALQYRSARPAYDLFKAALEPNAPLEHLHKLVNVTYIGIN